jgi:hypothetical protein
MSVRNVLNIGVISIKCGQPCSLSWLMQSSIMKIKCLLCTKFKSKTKTKIVPVLERATERTKTSYECNFLIICRYFRNC